MSNYYHFENVETGSPNDFRRVTARGRLDGPFRRARSFGELSIGLKRERENDAARRTAEQIEAMIADFDLTARRLDDEIKVEQDRTRIHDPAHFAYSTSAKAMILRRDNLKRTIAELKRQFATVKPALSETNEA
jgi:flagellar FliJ protein